MDFSAVQFRFKQGPSSNVRSRIFMGKFTNPHHHIKHAWSTKYMLEKQSHKKGCNKHRKTRHDVLKQPYHVLSIHIRMMWYVEHQQSRVSECVCLAVDVDRCPKTR